MTLEQAKEKYPVGSKWKYEDNICVIKDYDEYDTIIGKEIDLIVSNEVYNRIAVTSVVEQNWVRYE